MDGNNPVQTIQNYIRGINFPANRQQIIDYAKSKGAEANHFIMGFLEKIPDKTYESFEVVKNEIEKII